MQTLTLSDNTTAELNTHIDGTLTVVTANDGNKVHECGHYWYTADRGYVALMHDGYLNNTFMHVESDVVEMIAQAYFNRLVKK